MKVSTETKVIDKKIFIDSFIETENGRDMFLSTRQKIASEMYNTRDEAMIKALVSLGWTPPEKDKK